MLLLTQLQCAALSGVCMHLLVFIRGEYHRYVWNILTCYSLSIFAVYYFERRDAADSQYAWNPTLVVGVHYAALFGSMSMYRAFFHPLKSYPGPFQAKLSKLWHVSQVLNRQNHVFLEGLRKQYGTIVRTGPSELTVFDPEIFHIISGAGTTCIKSTYYDLLYPLVALISIREKDGYTSRRKLWDQSLKATALKRDVPAVLKYAMALVHGINKIQGKPAVVNDCFSGYAYAVMSDLAFGRSFATLDDEEIIRNVTLIQSGFTVLGFIFPTPWLSQLLFSLPGVAYSWNRMMRWSEHNIEDRLNKRKSECKDGRTRGDISSWLIEAAQTAQGQIDTNELYGDALLVTVAGSHSIAATLIFLFYELSRRPEIQTKLRSYINNLGELPDVDALSNLQYLNGCIEETFRLYPILPTGGSRQTKEVGIMVAGHYIPPYTTVVAPRYSIGRLDSCFDRSAEFIPERWAELPELVKDHRAHVPFSIGRHTCPGRSLGLMEIRIAAALLLARFEVTLAPGERNKAEVVDNMTDNFSVHPGQLRLVFRRLDGATVGQQT